MAGRKKKQRSEPGTPAPAPTPRPPRSAKHMLREGITSLAVALVAWLVIQSTLIKSFRINSGSMEQTLLPGEMLFVNRAVFGGRIPLVGARLPGLRDPRRDEVVVFRSPVPVAFAAQLGIEPNVDVVKRVIAVPGDTLAMRGDSLFRNGRYVPEPHAQLTDPSRSLPGHVREAILAWQRPQLVGGDSAYVPRLRDWGPLVIPADRYFVMGDNRDESVDSRFWGFLPRENVLGRVLIIYFSYDPASWRPLPFLTAIRWGRLLHLPR